MYAGFVSQPKTDGCYAAIGKVLVSRHVRAGYSEFHDARERFDSLCRRRRCGHVQKGSERQIGGQSLEACSPYLSRAPVRGMTSCAVIAEQTRTRRDVGAVFHKRSP
jgi:hypothetical protein